MKAPYVLVSACILYAGITPVKYSKKPPQIWLTDAQSKDEAIIVWKLVGFKSKSWKFEKNWINE